MRHHLSNSSQRESRLGQVHEREPIQRLFLTLMQILQSPAKELQPICKILWGTVILNVPQYTSSTLKKRHAGTECG